MANSVTVSISASNVSAHKLKKIHESSSELANEPKVHVAEENFVLHNARQGQEKVENINLISFLVLFLTLNHVPKISKFTRNSTYSNC